MRHPCRDFIAVPSKANIYRDSMQAWLNYHHLYYFWMIAREGSIARASKKLRLGQPTLSTQLKQLEMTLGHALFDRRRRQLHITETGRQVLEYAEQIFQLGREMQEVVNDRLSKRRIHLQIGVLDSIAKSLIVKCVSQALKAADCVVSILEGKGNELQRELAAHHIDLVLANYPLVSADYKPFTARRLTSSPVVVCAAKQYASLRRNFPKSLNGQPFVLPTLDSRLRHDVDHFFKTKQINVDAVAETQDVSLQKQLGINGIGCFAVAKVAAEPLLRSHQLIEIGRLQGVVEEIWLMSATRRIENPVAAKLFADLIID